MVLKDGNLPDNGQVVALQKLSEGIEDPYLDALGNDENMDTHPELLMLFKQARAIDVLVAAANADAKEAVGNAFYEAIHASISEGEIKELIASRV
jgi:hypothetical protein